MGDSLIARAPLSRTRGRTEQLRAQLIDVLNEDHPQSVRQRCAGQQRSAQIIYIGDYDQSEVLHG